MLTLLEASAGWASALRLLLAAKRFGASLPLGVALLLLLLPLLACRGSPSSGRLLKRLREYHLQQRLVGHAMVPTVTRMLGTWLGM